MTFPRNGPLSGMAVVALGAAAAVVAGLVPAWRGPFAAAPSPELLDAFAASIAVMCAHKVESYAAREFDVCPVYLTIAHDETRRNRGQHHFRMTIGPLMAGLVVIALTMRGPPWPLLWIGAWLTQALHEVHHVAKSIVRRSIYPGTWTAIGFVACMDAAVAPRWFAEVGAPGLLTPYLAAQALLGAAFFVEHRAWTRRYAAWQAG